MQCNVLYCFAKTARHDHHFALSDVLGAKWDKHLADVHSRCCPVGLSKGSTHATGKSICTRTWQSLVDAKHVERVRSDPDVEEVLSPRCHIYRHQRGPCANLCWVKFASDGDPQQDLRPSATAPLEKTIYYIPA